MLKGLGIQQGDVVSMYMPMTPELAIAMLACARIGAVHSVIFAGSGERITLAHSAEDRTIFAHGALGAAKWGHGKKPGLYSMTDVLGL